MNLVLPFSNNLQSWKKYAIPLLRCLLGVSFAAAGFLKLFPLDGFLAQMHSYSIPIPPDWQNAMAIPLIAFEIWVGLSILFHVNLKPALFSAQFLLLFMIPVTIWGTMHGAPTCGCYGTLVKRAPWEATIEDLLLLIVCFVLLPEYKQEKTKRHIVLEVLIILVSLIAAAYGIHQFFDMQIR